MNIKHIIILLGLTALMSCNGSGCNNSGDSATRGTIASTAPGQPIGQGLDIAGLVQKRGKIIVPACIIVPLDRIASVVGVSPDDIEIRDSSPNDVNPSHSSCFFKWEDSAVVSAGILLQVRKNPLKEEEYPDYIQMFIDSKRNVGEQDTDGGKYLFDTFPGFGDDGVYSHTSGKYFWQMGNKVLMSIAFNTSHTDEQQYQIASTLATDMINNYVQGF